ncbi:MAG: hypothetical protein JWO03_903 [Bacteroidetes bacterium]|nr:hypothetical protein [Bacteroidota bacterium]
MEKSETQKTLEALAGKLAKQCFNFYEESIDKIEIDYVPDAVSVTLIVSSASDKRVVSASTWLSTLLSSKRLAFHQETLNCFRIIGIPAFLDAFKPYQDPAPQTSLNPSSNG